ncbi:MAG: LysR family transcriptional regulator [Candidatus Competibacterales bacterium]
MRLDIPHLRAFATVAEVGNFTRAAERLALTQSAVSWQVKRLEERLGRTLLRREPWGVTPTPDGRELLAHAVRVLVAHAAAVAHLLRSELRGRVRFGCAEDLIAERLAQVLGRFRRTHPGVRLEVIVDTSSALHARVTAGEIDAALVQQGVGVGEGVVLWREEPLWVGSVDVALPMEPLPLVAFGRDCLYRQLACAALDRRGAPWFPVLEAPSIASVRAALLAGVGVGVLAARHMVTGLVALDTSLLPPLPPLDYALIGQGSAEVPATRALVTEVREALGLGSRCSPAPGRDDAA